MAVVRVGSPDSPVKQGDVVPGEPGKYYENGQFSPSVDSIITSTFSEAKESGLLSDNLPIMKDGKVDPAMVEAWNPYRDIPGVSISSAIPKFSMATLMSVHNMFPRMIEGVGITSILDGAELEKQEGGKAIYGASLVTVKGNRSRNTFYIHPPYQQYMTIPVVPEIPGRRKGLSVSAFATLKACGHALFNKMTSEGEFELIGRFISAAGWKKDYASGEKGSFLGRKNMGNYYRMDDASVTSEVAKYSPVDDFADTFAQYITHRNYLKTVAPSKADVMEDVFDRYRII